MNDPIKWEFTQQDIEYHMNLLNDCLILTKNVETINKALIKVKKEWQRKIDWNKERGNWK